ncbi:ATP phosphoribosyltransferase regulatory subunit [Leptodesmis sp.]|uniref:ATP phosphoribosyltransferase regulatory subunit n=1 Tax=Leptodesmis sp. TaxID=3100501 RepID=UPI0040534EE4
MVYQSPSGARDLLPLDVVQKRWIEERLQQVFRRWGYHRIITSSLERLDTLMAGGAIQPSTVLRVQSSEDEDLGLRPELTASIARTVVTRMAGSAYPLRLYYNANVFRRAQDNSHNRQQEFYQAGVELLGVGGLLADAETLLLVMDCLQTLGLQQWSIVLGDAGLTRSLLSPFPDSLQSKIRTAIANLDRVALETLPMSEELRDRALLLLDLRGKPEIVLEQVASLDLKPAQRASLNNLKSLIELLSTTHPPQTFQQSVSTNYPPSPAPLPTAHSLLLDLSLIQSLDYYTGIVFEVVSHHPSGIQVLGQGGRYDQLLGLYDPQAKSHPGIGFALHIEHLHQVLLLTGQLPQQTPTSDWLIVPETAQAYPVALAYAQNLRMTNDHLRVELELGSRTPSEVYDYARHRLIPQIAWIQVSGEAKVEKV